MSDWVTQMDGEYTAIVDRIVDGDTAVVLIETDGDVIEQFDIPAVELPTECAPGSVLSVVITANEIVEMTLQSEETQDRRERIQERFDRLSKRLGDEE